MEVQESRSASRMTHRTAQPQSAQMEEVTRLAVFSANSKVSSLLFKNINEGRKMQLIKLYSIRLLYESTLTTELRAEQLRDESTLEDGTRNSFIGNEARTTFRQHRDHLFAEHEPQVPEGDAQRYVIRHQISFTAKTARIGNLKSESRQRTLSRRCKSLPRNVQKINDVDTNACERSPGIITTIESSRGQHRLPTKTSSA